MSKEKLENITYVDAAGKGDDTVVEINLFQLFYHYLLNWKILVITLLIGALLGFGYQHYFVGTTYSSSAAIFIADTEHTIDITDINISSQLSVDYQKILRSRTTLKEVIADTGVDMDYNRLSELIEISQDDDSHIITISVTTSDKYISRALADSLMRVGSKRIQEVTTSGNPTVVDYATMDAVTTVKMGLRRYPAIGGLLGLVLALALLFVQFMMDRSFKSEDEIIEKLKKPILSAVPYYGSDRNLITTELNYYEKEAFNTLYGNISLSGVENRVIAITSSNENEGKSSLAFNIAKTITDFGKTVCYVDCDMRNSDFNRLYGLDKNKVNGLSELLSGQNDVTEIFISDDENDKLKIITAGKIPPNPSALLSGKRFTKLVEALRQSFDYVILDTPPVNAVIDGIFVSKQCDGTVMVIESSVTDDRQAVRAMNDLNMADINVLGIIINKVGKKPGYGYGYGYGYGRKKGYGYGYGYGYGRRKGYGYGGKNGYGYGYGYGYGKEKEEHDHKEDGELNGEPTQ